MDFRTVIPISKVSTSITYHSSIVSLGSCFAVNMGEKFAYYKFPITLNPFGILFHPFAIENIIANFCFLTLGTAWVYIYNSTDRIVANCHKLPQQHFSKRLLSMEEIGESLTRIAQLLKQINPSIHLVITISPVRHIKDGFLENQVSKSLLFSALYPLITSGYYTYFPAYELLLDELRDYRFYANDMVHPSEMAINYIWERLVASYIDTATQMDMKQAESIQKALLHRPFNPDTEKHQQFLIQLQQKMEVFTMKYPHIKF